MALMWHPWRRRAIEWGFSLLYNELAWSYDAVSWLVSQGQWRAWQQAGLAFLPPPTTGGRVLELAHGPGHLLLALHAAGYKPVGVDLSPFMGRQAQRRLRRARLDVPLIRAAAQALPFTAGAFDGALATFPAAFMLQPETAAQIWRLLRPGGRLVIVPQAQFTGRGPCVRLLEWLYAITGQRMGVAEEALAAGPWRSLAQAGFRLRQETVSLPRSRALVVIAEKMPYNYEHDDDRSET